MLGFCVWIRITNQPCLPLANSDCVPVLRLSRAYSSYWLARRLRTTSISSLVLCEEIKQNITFIVILETSSTAVFHQHYTVADLDLELRGGEGEVGAVFLRGPSAFRPSAISSFFTQNKGGSVPLTPSLDPPLLHSVIFFSIFYLQNLKCRQAIFRKLCVKANVRRCHL